MKHGLLIFVRHAHVFQGWSLVRWYDVPFIHIVVICINQKMNVVQNVEVNYLNKRKRKVRH